MSASPTVRAVKSESGKPSKPKKATSDKPALAIVTTGLKKSELPSAKRKHSKSARLVRYEQYPLSSLSRPKIKLMAQAYGIRMLTSDGCAALRTITEENVLNVILAAMTMTANAQRTIVSKNDINYALDLKRV